MVVRIILYDDSRRESLQDFSDEDLISSEFIVTVFRDTNLTHCDKFVQKPKCFTHYSENFCEFELDDASFSNRSSKHGPER